MEYFLNQLINGLCQGSIYALMAIGYSVIVGVVGMVTFTYGEIMMIGAFSAYYIFLLVGNNLPLAIMAAFAGSFVIGIVVYKLCYEKFFNAPRHISLLCTIGISMLIKNLPRSCLDRKQNLYLISLKIRRLPFLWEALIWI